MFNLGANKQKRGFSLVEMLIFLTIFVIVGIGFFRIMSMGLRSLAGSRARIAAVELAAEKMEIIRSMPYEKIGTANGSPTGVLADSEQETRSNILFNVSTIVENINDTFDDNLGDVEPNDYKQVKIITSWKYQGADKSIVTVAHIAPPGTEDLYTGGILSIGIRGADGVPVEGALVEVDSVVGTYHPAARVTGADGRIYIIGLDAGDKNYKIKVTKDGYFPVETMAPYDGTTVLFDPVDEHASVIENSIWPQTIEFNRLVNINLKTKNPAGNLIPNVDFSLEGGRKIGDTVPDNLPIYSYTLTDNKTNETGEFDLADVSSGNYIFTFRDTTNNENYEFWRMDTVFNNVKNIFHVEAGTTANVIALLLPKNLPSCLLTVTDKADNSPILDAQVKLKDSLGVEHEGVTDQFGQVYFGESLLNGSFELGVTVPGYADFSQTIDINNLTKPIVQLDKL